MAECECLPKCPFFHDRMENKPATAQLMKNTYCLGDSEGCARHQIFKAVGGSFVPGDLYPSQVERVSRIIQEARASR